VPGNHDYYTKEAALKGSFEESFARYLPREFSEEGEEGAPTYPVSKLISSQSGESGESGERVALFGLSSAIPTASFMATGEVGEAQRARLQAMLKHPKAEGAFRLLMLHHPLFPEPKRRLDVTRRLRDAEALIADLEGSDHPPQLIIHGHNHEFKRQALPQSGAPVLQVGSASRVTSGRHSAEFHVYVISQGALLRVERHIHNPEQGRFVACDEAGAPLEV
jgi:3',5'-cyclic AMP phosphodiesterase CpdA